MGKIFSFFIRAGRVTCPFFWYNDSILIKFDKHFFVNRVFYLLNDIIFIFFFKFAL